MVQLFRAVDFVRNSRRLVYPHRNFTGQKTIDAYLFENSAAWTTPDLNDYGRFEWKFFRSLRMLRRGLIRRL